MNKHQEIERQLKKKPVTAQPKTTTRWKMDYFRSENHFPGQPQGRVNLHDWQTEHYNN